MTGVEAKRMRKTMNHTVSPLQLVAGDDRRLHHGVAMARDAIQAAGKNKMGCGILDTDLVAKLLRLQTVLLVTILFSS